MSAAPAGRRLRADLPFQRIALVLSGGGALGAYEVGVLKVLGSVRLAPALVAGVSIGAINAVAWLAHGRNAAALEAEWRGLRGSGLGMQWLTLGLRFAGLLTAMLAFLEVMLTLIGSRELSGSYWLWRRASARLDLASTQLDIMAWLVVLVLGVALMLGARRLERWLRGRESSLLGPLDPSHGRRLLGRVALGAAALHFLVWAMGWPWPHRFSASIVTLLALVWLTSGPGAIGHWLRGISWSLTPETGGRGLWSGRARQRVLERLVRGGDGARLVGPGTGLVVSALAVDSGRVCHFVSWPHPDPAFVEHMQRELGEVVALRSPEEAVRAAVASSALPGVFEPETIDGREFVDAGGFSNQPLHVVIAAQADATLVVLLQPSHSPSPVSGTGNLATLAGRLLELANWRDLQTELRSLPPGWTTAGQPARVCVIEPPRPLPSTLLDFDPAAAARLIDLGEQDAWHALEAAGWLEPSAVRA